VTTLQPDAQQDVGGQHRTVDLWLEFRNTIAVDHAIGRIDGLIEAGNIDGLRVDILTGVQLVRDDVVTATCRQEFGREFVERYGVLDLGGNPCTGDGANNDTFCIAGSGKYAIRPDESFKISLCRWACQDPVPFDVVRAG